MAYLEFGQDRLLNRMEDDNESLPDAPDGLLSLDPQLICYSWISGIPEVALVVFVRKHAAEVQYLKATISEEQRQEFGRRPAHCSKETFTSIGGGTGWPILIR